MLRALRLLVPLALTLASLFASPIVDFAEARSGRVSVRGHYRKDGTYVRPHYRSAPDGNFNNNWSTKGNVNPYTGESGTKDSPPASYGRDAHVEGYTRKDGTYVPSHYRSAPDGDASNNWSTEGNVNPYTSEVGTKPLEGSSSDLRSNAYSPVRPANAIQYALTIAGYSLGPVDGVIGPKTVAAMSRYRKDHELHDLPISLALMQLADDVRTCCPALADELVKTAIETVKRD